MIDIAARRAPSSKPTARSYGGPLASPDMGYWGRAPSTCNNSFFATSLWSYTKYDGNLLCQITSEFRVFTYWNKCVGFSSTLCRHFLSFYVRDASYFDVILCPYSHYILATPLQWSINKTDRRTDRQTPYRYIDPVAHYASSVNTAACVRLHKFVARFCPWHQAVSRIIL